MRSFLVWWVAPTYFVFIKKAKPVFLKCTAFVRSQNALETYSSAPLSHHGESELRSLDSGQIIDISVNSNESYGQYYIVDSPHLIGRRPQLFEKTVNDTQSIMEYVLRVDPKKNMLYQLVQYIIAYTKNSLVFIQPVSRISEVLSRRSRQLRVTHFTCGEV